MIWKRIRRALGRKRRRRRTTQNLDSALAPDQPPIAAQVEPPSRPAWRVFSFGSSLLKGIPWPVLWSVLTFGSLWLFALVPWLRPWEPPVEREILIPKVWIAERRFVHPALGELSVAFFDIKTVGYEADKIAVQTLWLYAATNERAETKLRSWGTIEPNTRRNEWTHWINVPYPDLPFEQLEGQTNCLRLRVLLLRTPRPSMFEPITSWFSGGQSTSKESPLSDPAPGMPLLAYADSEPFDPTTLGPGDCASLDTLATAGTLAIATTEVLHAANDIDGGSR